MKIDPLGTERGIVVENVLAMVLRAGMDDHVSACWIGMADSVNFGMVSQ